MHRRRIRYPKQCTRVYTFIVASVKLPHVYGGAPKNAQLNDAPLKRRGCPPPSPPRGRRAVNLLPTFASFVAHFCFICRPLLLQTWATFFWGAVRHPGEGPPGASLALSGAAVSRGADAERAPFVRENRIVIILYCFFAAPGPPPVRPPRAVDNFSLHPGKRARYTPGIVCRRGLTGLRENRLSNPSGRSQNPPP